MIGREALKPYFQSGGMTLNDIGSMHSARSSIATYRTAYGSKRFVQSPIDLEMEDVYDLLDWEQIGVVSAAQFNAVASRAGVKNPLYLFNKICERRGTSITPQRLFKNRNQRDH